MSGSTEILIGVVFFAVLFGLQKLLDAGKR